MSKKTLLHSRQQKNHNKRPATRPTAVNKPAALNVVFASAPLGEPVVLGLPVTAEPLGVPEELPVAEEAAEDDVLVDSTVAFAAA